MSYHTRRVGANVVVARGGKILLQRRQNTGWGDGMLGIPGGHLEDDETPVQGIIREIGEELGLRIGRERLEFYATQVIRTNTNYINSQFYIELTETEDPKNTEPERCSELVWVDPHDLPDDVLDIFRYTIEEAYLGGSKYIEIGY